MYLFETKKVRNFFDRLTKQGRVVNELYDKKCSKEVFLKRACKKYVGKKYWVYGGFVRRPVFIIGFRFNYGHRDAIIVYYIDYTDPQKLKEEELGYNDLYKLEGIEVFNGFGDTEKMFLIDDPEKTFIFSGNYLLKPGQRKFRTGTLEISAKTIELAFKELDRYIGENKDNIDRLIFNNYGNYTIK